MSFWHLNGAKKRKTYENDKTGVAGGRGFDDGVSGVFYMSTYQAPLKDMRFVMRELAGLDQIIALPGWQETDSDTIDSILQEAARFASEVFSPLNRTGDQQGVKWKDGNVITATGFREAYQKFSELGWNRLGFGADYGGHDVPALVTAPVHEMWKSANLAFSACFQLTQGAVEALTLCGSDEQKKTFLPKIFACSKET